MDTTTTFTNTATHTTTDTDIIITIIIRIMAIIAVDIITAEHTSGAVAGIDTRIRIPLRLGRA